MSQEEIFINGELLRLRREAKGWVLNDMATRACMSVKQIRQLEEGGISAFYSQAVKLTAAKKVGVLLGLSVDEVFAQPSADGSIEQTPDIELHSLETDEQSVPSPAFTDMQQELPQSMKAADSLAQVVSVEDESSAVDAPPKKSKTSIWLISGLFLAALLVAAYMQPQEEPLSAEPAPPIQVVPSESAEPASAAESPASAASMDIAPVPKSVASAATVVASAVRASSAAGSATTTAPVVTLSPAASKAQ